MTSLQSSQPRQEMVAARGGIAARARRIDPRLLLQLLAIVPALVIVDLVRDSSQLQWLDYWTVLARFMEPGGGLRPLDLVFFHEGHVPIIPSLIVWLNVQLTGGLAHALGYYDIAVLIAQLFLLRSLLPRPERLGAWWFSLLVVAFAVLLFAPQGAWNFARSASGVSWLTANLLTLLAIRAAVRGRVLWALPFAALASITYATGLMAWPAIVLIAFLRGNWGWRQWTVTGAGALTLAIYALERPPSAASASGFAPNDIARRMFQVSGSVLSPDPQLALTFGAVGIGLAAVLAATCWQRRELRADALPWIALAVYAALAALLIGLGRGGLHEDDLGVASRYASLSILLWIAILALAVLRFRTDLRLLPAAFAIAALAFASGQPTLAGMRSNIAAQDELAIAVRMGASDGYTYAPNPRHIPLFQSVDHYPFSDDFDADCGLLGDRLDGSAVVPPSAGASGHLDRFESAYNDDTVRLAGWYTNADGATRCVVFTDETLRVIGAAALGITRPDLAAVGSPTGEFDVGFVGPAEADAEQYRAFALIDGSDAVYEIPGTLDADDQETEEQDAGGA